ncbi:MAG: CPBP family intramembrane metalloprotease [Ardenticatenaceae bacterium]|nr:CPBP family intramembrane metalloprotease [Ardenticatenaceae bacterium]
MRSSRLSGPWAYFVLTLGWSWLFWIVAIVLSQPAGSLLTLLLIAMGGLGPAITGISLTYLTRGPAGRRDYWRRVIDFKRIGLRWYAVIFLLHPLLAALAVATGLLSGESLPAFDQTAGYLAAPLSLLGFVVFTLFFGPVPEELGWRGYVLDRLQARWSALTSSLVLGIVHVAWHLPLFFIAAHPIGHVFPMGSVRFWLDFVAGTVVLAVMLTWLYNNTGRSTLAAILFHFMGNFTGEFLELPDPLRQYQTLWSIALAVAVVLVWNSKTMTRRRPGPAWADAYRRGAGARAAPAPAPYESERR